MELSSDVCTLATAASAAELLPAAAEAATAVSAEETVATPAPDTFAPDVAATEFSTASAAFCEDGDSGTPGAEVTTDRTAEAAAWDAAAVGGGCDADVPLAAAPAGKEPIAPAKMLCNKRASDSE